MSVDPKLRAIVARFAATFATDRCIQGVLADFLEDHVDPRADVVRAEKIGDEDCTHAQRILYSHPGQMGVYENVNRAILAKARSMLRRRILARFPECYPPFHPGALLTDLPGIGACQWEDGESSIGLIIGNPNESGEFAVGGVYATGYPHGGRIPCRIGYHVPKRIAVVDIGDIREPGSIGTCKSVSWEWKYALVQPELATA